MFEIAIGIAIGVAEFNGVGAACGRGEGDDDHRLHTGVHHRAVNRVAHAVIDRNVHVTEVLVELDLDELFSISAGVDGIIAGTGYNGVGADAKH